MCVSKNSSGAGGIGSATCAPGSIKAAIAIIVLNSRDMKQAPLRLLPVEFFRSMARPFADDRADHLEFILGNPRSWPGDGDRAHGGALAIDDRRGHAVDSREPLGAIEREAFLADPLEFLPQGAPGGDRGGSEAFE